MHKSFDFKRIVILKRYTIPKETLPAFLPIYKKRTSNMQKHYTGSSLNFLARPVGAHSSLLTQG
jgi:hypothetical protein